MIGAVVAIPARNEADRIGACLSALATQAGVRPGSLGIVLLVNNTTDATLTAIEAARPALQHELRVVVRDSPEANAGWARGAAMDVAAGWLAGVGSYGALLTTDADSQVAPDWVVRNLAALTEGADAVAGTISLDPTDAARLSPALRARGKLEAEYHGLLDEVAAIIDPDPHDPWPNHTVESGASLAVTSAAYREVGGVPPIALGDDRAFVARLRERGFRIRHDPAVRVVTSGRLVGRAHGGVADTMRARENDPDCLCDARLEPFPLALAACAGGVICGGCTRAVGSGPNDGGSICSISHGRSWTPRQDPTRPAAPSLRSNVCLEHSARPLSTPASFLSTSALHARISVGPRQLRAPSCLCCAAELQTSRATRAAVSRPNPICSNELRRSYLTGDQTIVARMRSDDMPQPMISGAGDREVC